MGKVDVARTNDSCTTSKAGLACLGYTWDRAVQCFVKKKQIRRSPLINRVYFIRHFAIRDCIRRFIAAYSAEPKFQMINLGAGFDCSYFELALPENCLYIEVDLASVVENKIALIEDNKANLFGYDEEKGSAVIETTKHGACIASNYILLGCDMSNIALFKATLSEYADFHLPTLIIAECSLTYLSNMDADGVLQFFGREFSRCSAVIYEQICPDDAFGRFMLKHFDSLKSPLRSIHRYPTLKAVRERLSKFFGETANCGVCEMNHAYMNVLPVDEHHRLEQLEPFDEFEMFHLTNAHYALGTVSGNRSANLFQHLHTPIEPESLPENQCSNVSTTEFASDLRRFHHAAAFFELNGSIFELVCGGIGIGSGDGRHSRIAELSTLEYNDVDNRCSARLLMTDSLLDRSLHCFFALNSNRLLIFGGRQSPMKPAPLLVELTCSGDNTNWQIKAIPSSITERWRCAAVMVEDDNKKPALFFCGGRSVNGVLNDTGIVCCSDDGYTFSSNCPALPIALHSHSATYDKTNCLVYVSGGLDHLHRPNSTILIFNLRTNSWSTFLKTNVDYARFGHTSHFIRLSPSENDGAIGKLILIGGTKTDHSAHTAANSIILIDLEDGQVETVANCSDDTILLGHSSVQLDSEQLIFKINGGGGNCFSFGTRFNNNGMRITIRNYVCRRAGKLCHYE